MHLKSIKTTLIAPTVLVIVVTGLIVSYLSLQNARDAVNDISRILRQEISQRVIGHLDGFFATPQQVLEELARLLRQGKLSPNNADLLQEHFLHESKQFPEISSFYFGNTDGGVAVGGRESSGDAFYKIDTEAFKAGPFRKYRVDEEGNKGALLMEIPDFDARTRSWYKAAIQARSGAWGEIYVVFTGDQLALAASRAVRDQEGNIIGVVGGDIFLSSVSRFLGSLHDDRAGLTFITEKSGLLVASSAGELPFAVSQDGTVQKQLRAVDSSEPQIAASARAIAERFGGFAGVAAAQSLAFEIDGNRHFLEITPFEDSFGLSLLVATIVPEKAYLSALEKGSQQNLYFIFAVFVLMAAIMTLIARWITEPIQDLKKQVDDVADGKADGTLALDRNDEIGDLSRAFMDMTGRLNETFRKLRDSDAKLSNQVNVLRAEIARREESELALTESERRYRETVEHSTDLITIVNSEGRFIFVNHTSKNVFGIPPEECIGMSAFEFIHPEDREATMAMFGAWIAGSETSVKHQNRQVSRDGAIHQISWNIAIHYDEAGKPKTLTSIGRDTTQQQLLEEQLYQAQKMEAVGQLTGGIAHDFNNLMAVIMGNLEEASERSRNNPDTVAYIDAAIATVERGASLTQQLLSFSSRQALNPRIEPLRSLLSDFQKLFHRTIGEDIRLDVQLPDDEIVVEIDRAMFGNTILNLALNARDSMPNGGNLTISAAPCVLDGKIFQESGPISGRFVRISVSDTGTGITAQNLGRVFEPFFTTKDVGEGSGLGLSMAYGFINQSKGHIEIRSKIGEGTTVSLYLPVAEPRSESEGQDAARAPDAGMDTIPGKTVLVVEDDSLVRQTTTATLKSLGYVVIEASSGPTARKILEENAESIDIVFSDVIMPDGMTGLDLAREIQSRHPHVRILLTSGYAESRLSRSDHDYISDAGIHILPKPFRRSALTKALSMLSVA